MHAKETQDQFITDTLVVFNSGLQKYLNQLGFNIVGYGCTTCIGNSGDIDEAVGAAITENGKDLFMVSGYSCHACRPYVIMLRILY